MAWTLCIKDRFGDVHATRCVLEADPENVEAAAREFARDMAVEDGETIKVGVGQPKDPGLARLRDGIPYADGGIDWLYDMPIGK